MGMHLPATFRCVTATLLALGVLLSGAPASAAEPVIEPTLERARAEVPSVPSTDFELGTFLGMYSMQNIGADLVEGFRVGYHLTQSVFVESTWGHTKLTDQNFRTAIPGGLFPQPNESLVYYNLDLGYNVFQGEMFFGNGHAKVSSFYLIGGVGDTRFIGNNHATLNAGLGWRVYLKDWAAVQVDARDHIFSTNVLGPSQSNQNLEYSLGVTLFF